jgi:uncharacterized repeat protein (TIGR01451 family)
MGLNRSTHRSHVASRCVSRFVAAVAVWVAVLSVHVAVAGAVVPAPAWQVTAVGAPTELKPAIGTEGQYNAVVENVGGAPSEGVTVVRDRLPKGLTIIEAEPEPSEGLNGEFTECISESEEVVCSFPEVVVPGGFLVVNISLYKVTGALAPGASLQNVIHVSGGGAPEVSGAGETHVLGEGEKGPGPGGIAHFAFSATGPAGEVFSQAGGHPNLLTTSILFNTIYVTPGGINARPVEAPRDVVFYLPLGMLGDPAVAEPCPPTSVETRRSRSDCPPGSRVGSVLPMILGNIFANNSEDPTSVRPIYSVIPEKGYAAEFAFSSNNLEIVMYANVVRHDGAYMLRVSVPGVPTVASLIGFVASFYGDEQEHYLSGEEPVTFDRGAFLTAPSDCGEGEAAREASVEFNTWEDPEAEHTASALTFPSLEGCEKLSFGSLLSSGPDVRVAGDTTMADEPSGYTTNLEVPQAPNDGSGLGTPPLKTVDFTFPAGTSLSPGAANGLVACAATGPHGIDFPSGTGVAGEPGSVTGEGEEDAADGLPRPAQGDCPPASIVANVTATSPLLKEALAGHLYLAEPECGNSSHPNPCTDGDAAGGSLYRLYLELEAPGEGVIVKLPGSAHVDPVTGQITSVFEDTPQFPVGDLRIETTSGPRAVLANPQACGTATTTGLVEPWSGGPASTPTGSFQVNEGCGPQGFSPSFTAGSVSALAGAYTPFTLTLKREDREQDLGALKTTLPEGLLAAVSHVAQCPEPQASQGNCPQASRVGSTTVAVGSGSQPLYQTGEVYFTGPYGGAPFGLSVLVHAVAGPFDLGDVVVRVALSIDPNTAQVTASTPPAGAPGGLPQILDGVPLRIRMINVTLDSPSFTFNPTNCTPRQITGVAYSTQGSQDIVGSPFAASGCDNLPFKPILTASTRGKVSKTQGASLTVKVASGAGQANIAKVSLQLPRLLPTRLSTLQKACTEAQFNANPAGCPEGSTIGTGTALTPILGVLLVGPAILVSHGGAAFPDVEFVLQGEGVKIVLDGKTQIKHGTTYSRFESVPDAPISSFQATLPEGPNSVLTVPASANGVRTSLCKEKLSMPTLITAQNGATVKQTTKVAVTGCTKSKTKRHKHAHKPKRKKHR